MASPRAVAIDRNTAIERLSALLNRLTASAGLDAVEIPRVGRYPDMLHNQQLELIADTLEALLPADANGLPEFSDEKSACADFSEVVSQPIHDMTGKVVGELWLDAEGNILHGDIIAVPEGAVYMQPAPAGGDKDAAPLALVDETPAPYVEQSFMGEDYGAGGTIEQAKTPEGEAPKPAAKGKAKKAANGDADG